MDEAAVLAQNLFRSQAARYLSEEEIEEVRKSGTVASGTPTRRWEAIIGRPAVEREFYEYQVYKPSDQCPYVEKIYAVFLVSRNRENEDCYVQWKPAVEPDNGPWFS